MLPSMLNPLTTAVGQQVNSAKWHNSIEATQIGIKVQVYEVLFVISVGVKNSLEYNNRDYKILLLN